MATSERVKRDLTDRSILSKIVNDLERSDKINSQSLEDKALDEFQSKYGSKGKFSSNSEHKKCLNILRFILEKKLSNSTTKLCSLPVFYCLRILLRDPQYQLVFIQENGMIGLKTQMNLCLTPPSMDSSDSSSESINTANKALEHMLNILLKLITPKPNHIERECIISSEIIESVTRLLNNVQDLTVLQNILRLLINMIGQTDLYVKEIIKSETIDSLLQILLHKDLEIKQLSLQLMANFLGHPEGRKCVPGIPHDFLEAFTSHLSHNNVKVLDHTIWCLTHCAENEDNRRRIRLTGAIPLLLSLLENGNRFFDFSLPSINANHRQTSQNVKKPSRDDTEAVSRRDQLFDMQSACCTCLAELSYDYTNGQTIIERNGIYILAMLLFPDNEDLQRLEKFHHLQLSVFRTLRYLFSLNKNRDQYRRLLPTNIFELFLSIGNFQRDLNFYKPIADIWNAMSVDELAKIKLERLQSLNPKLEPTRYIRDYGVYECLGSGAFGSVYRVARRGTTSTMYALKEIDNRSISTDTDRSLGQKINEVKIIREELRHPNIVSYYRIFAENEKLYIVMELIAGSSLQDYLSLLKETNRTMTEDNIWKVFIQLILALRYLHKEKGIVHRDLTANNIMLDDEYRVKITDFGLAKLRDNDCSKMNSVVGTLYYACPEIIQHMPYNEKADIWSLGCVLYHMATLVPPFFTSNILLLASKICSAEYDQAPLKSYSDRIQQIIVECLSIDPQSRPDICAVAKLCTEQLMLYTDRSCTTIQVLNKRLRELDHRREFDIIRQQSQLQQQLSNQHSCLSCSSTKESLGGNSGGIADVSFDAADGQQETLKAEAFTAVSDCETPDAPAKELNNGNIPQPPSGPIKINNIRRSIGRLSLEQVANSNEAMLYQARSPDQSNNISFESGYDSINTIQQPTPPSSSMSYMERKQSPFNRSRQPSITGSISISQKRLRPTDPVSQLLDIVHKLVYISFVPSNANNNRYRRLIDRYRIFLFLKGSSQNLKSELSKLSNHLTDCIEFDSGLGRQSIGLQSLANSSRSSSPSPSSSRAVDLTISDGSGCVTYEQMMTYIEQYLQETDYYKDTNTSVSSSESLPPAIQRNPRPPSGKK